MKNILVTGAAGFIGSHLVERLLEHDYQIFGVDNFSTGKRENIDYLIKLNKKGSFKFIEADICNQKLCLDLFKGMDYIFHQAALGSVPRSIKHPELYFKNNLGGFINVLESSRLNNVKRLIYASSSSVYGDTPKLPKSEVMPLNPKSPYALTKATGEMYAKMYQDTYGLEVIGFRYFNVFGQRQDPLSQYAAVIPKFFTQSIKGENLTVNGNGLQTRDFTYIENVINYNLLAMTSNFSTTNRVYNIGCGEQTSVLSLAKKIKEITDSNNKILFCDNRNGDVKNSLACLQLIKDNLGSIKIINLDDGLKNTFKWYQNDCLK